MGMMRGGMGRGMGGPGRGAMSELPRQGSEMDLLQFRVDGPARNSFRIPSRLPSLPSLETTVSAERTFRFESSMMRHGIDGRAFELERVDVRVPLGATERWTFVNDSEVPHPVHVHATQFRVLRRTGGRNVVLPAERGLKDTVLLLPGERVDVLLRFERHRGLFLLHCHNLEHEDAGMMANVQVV
jgi:FtsP/CotA-like multicopper oxidase with cupredoxin domain